MRLLVDEYDLPWESRLGDHPRHRRLHQPYADAGGAGALAGRPDGTGGAAPSADHQRDQPPLPDRSGDRLARTIPNARGACRSSRKATKAQVRMAHLAIVGSHSINGVSKLHSELVKTRLVPDFYQLWPERFSNKTNGVTQRRWLLMANPGLANLLDRDHRGSWVTDLEQLSGYRAAAPMMRSSRPAFARSSAPTKSASPRIINRIADRRRRSGRRSSTCRPSASMSTSANC